MARKTLQAFVKKGARASVRKKAVKTSEDLRQALFEWSDEAIFLFDRVGRCLDVNPSGCRLLGSSRRKLRGRSLTDILRSLDDSDDCRGLQGLRRGQAKTCRLRVCRDDGGEVRVDACAKGLANKRVLVILRKQADVLPTYEQLRQSERFLDSILEHLPNMVFIKDAADLRFVRFNNAGEKLLGYSRDELLGKNDYDFFPKPEADFFTAKDREVLASGRLLDIAEEPIQTQAHGMRHLHTKKIPILTEDGKPQYLLGLSEDITEQHQLRLREAHRNRQLKLLLELGLMLSGDPADVFDQSVRIIAELFAVKVVCLSEIIGRDLRFKSVYVNGVVLRDAGTCPLAGTPCATVEMTKDFRAFDRGTERFPEASFLKDRQAVACCRFPALDHTGKVMALTCLLDDKPHEFTEEDQDILRLFGQRIAAEIERARHAAERKRIEDKLRESEARLGFLLSATPAVIYSARATGDYGATFASDNLTKALGYSPEEFVGDPRFWADRIHPDDRERVFAELRRLFESGTYEHEYRFLHKDGTYRWMRDALEVIRDADGQPVELIGCWSDITDHKVAEEALAKAELYYRTIFQEAGVGVAQIDSQTGQFLKVNRKYCEIVGLTEDEMVAETFMSITHPDDLAEDIGFMDRLRRGELSSFAMEKRYIKKKDGSIVWVILNVAPLWQTGEIPSQHIAVIQDITARKQIEQELRTAKERFDLAVEGSKTGIWDWDLRTNHVHYSSLWKRQIGYQDHELEGRFEEWESRLHPEDLDQVLDTVQTYLRDQRSHYEAGRPYENEFRLRHKDGSYRWILARGVAIQDEEGQLYRMSGSHVDITEHKLAGEEWRKALALLRSVINATPDFIIAKDRELRTILCNNACAQAVGKSPNEMIGRTDIENGWDPELVCGNPEKGIRGFEADDRDALSGVVVHNLNDPAIVGGEVRRFDNYKAPLLGDGGEVIGMLGVARDVTDRIRMESDLKRNEARLQEAQRLAKLGNWELDLRSNTIVWSDEICRIFEIDAMQFGAFYESFLSAVHPDDRAMVNDAYTNSVAERKPYSLAHRLLMPDGRIKYVHERGETDYDQSGHPIRSHGTVQDVTERRLAELQIETALREKETLLREVHHRVKNNLQIISSLLYFQSKKIRDAEDLSAFRDGQDRLKSMILVHEKLYRSDNLTRIEFGDYVRALIDGIRQSHGPMSTKIDTVVDVPQISLPVEIAMPVGMIVNELLTNTFKYAFPGERKGVVRICATSAEEAFEVLFEDTGAGFPEGVDPDRPETFGLQLIHSLTAQLGGRLSFGREGGASVRVHVPIPVPA